MGTKFSHFSILDANINETIELLKLIPKKPNTLEIMKRMSPKEKPFPESISELKKPENVNDEQWQKLQKDWPKFIKYLKSQERTYYIGKNHDWTTVFSEEFGFESIDNYSLPLSKKTGKTFLTVGLFDEDVLTLSIIKNGNILTHHASGGEFYDIKDSLGDMNIFAEIFNLTNEKDKLENTLKSNNDDLYKKIEELEILFNMKLWLNRSVPRELMWKKVIC